MHTLNSLHRSNTTMDEKDPLQDLGPVVVCFGVTRWPGEFVLWVVLCVRSVSWSACARKGTFNTPTNLFLEVEENCSCLKNGKIVVVWVYQCWDAAVWIDLPGG